MVKEACVVVCGTVDNTGEKMEVLFILHYNIKCTITSLLQSYLELCSSVFLLRCSNLGRRDSTQHPAQRWQNSLEERQYHPDFVEEMKRVRCHQVREESTAEQAGTYREQQEREGRVGTQ